MQQRVCGRLESSQNLSMGLGTRNFEGSDFLNVLLLQGSSDLSDVRKKPNRLPAGSVMLCLFTYSPNKRYVNLILPEKSTGCLKNYITCCLLHLMEFQALKDRKYLVNPTITCMYQDFYDFGCIKLFLYIIGYSKEKIT